jgi:hypothetical protein
MRRRDWKRRQAEGDEGAQLALDLQNEIDGGEWSSRATEVMWALVRESEASGAEISANDLREIAGAPDRPCAMGAIFRAFSKAGVIVRAGMVPTNSPRAHARFVSTWVAAGRVLPPKTGKGPGNPRTIAASGFGDPVGFD